MSLDRTGRRQRFAFLSAAFATPKLSAVMALVFVSLSIPVLVFIFVYNYNRTSVAIIATLHEQVAKTRLATVDSAANLILPVGTTLRLLAEVAASDPSLLRTEQSRELLYRALTSGEQVDAVYVSFEDGYHRVVTRVDDNRAAPIPRFRRAPTGTPATSTTSLRARTAVGTVPCSTGGHTRLVGTRSRAPWTSGRCPTTRPRRRQVPLP